MVIKYSHIYNKNHLLGTTLRNPWILATNTIFSLPPSDISDASIKIIQYNIFKRITIISVETQDILTSGINSSTVSKYQLLTVRQMCTKFWLNYNGSPNILEGKEVTWTRILQYPFSTMFQVALLSIATLQHVHPQDMYIKKGTMCHLRHFWVSMEWCIMMSLWKV